jgi:ubiquitin C-terminal hydrolase
MLHTPILTNRFLSKGYSGTCEFTQEYYYVLIQMWRLKNNQPINPAKVLAQLQARYSQFRGSEPNDVQEVVLCIIDIFEKSIGDEWIKTHFYGTNTTKVTWPNGTSESHDLFACQMLEANDSFFEKNTTVNGFKDLNDKEWPEATINIKASKLGTVFMVCFNMYQEKKDVTIPKTFEFENSIYKLYSAAIHMGSHMGGHYAAIICHKDKWFIKDDCSVHKVSDFNTTGPYYFAMYKKILE